MSKCCRSVVNAARTAISGLLLFSVVLTVYLPCVTSFNVDTENYVKHRGEAGSMFGFTVAEHRERSESWILVGAPEAQTQQPAVEKGGGVFRCHIGQDDYCQEIPFDQRGNNYDRGQQIDQKSHQWFGATLQSSGEDGYVVACAPRYVYYTTNHERKEPVGTCYVARRAFSDVSEYSPCRTRNWGYNRQGSCQIGLGASISKDGKRLFLGAPGSRYWQGQIYSIGSSTRLTYTAPREIANAEGKPTSNVVARVLTGM